jgi:homospermidine synthase
MGVLQPLLRKFSQTNQSASPKWPVYGHISGPIVLLGFGSIGRGVLPLIDRHFTYDKSLFTVIDPSLANKSVADQYGVRFLQLAITPDNYVQVLTPLLKEGKAQAFCVNVSVDTSSRDIILLCQDIGALYIDTVVEPWPGLYFDKNLPTSERTNYMLRQGIVDIRSASQGRSTAISCCGANPGE